MAPLDFDDEFGIKEAGVFAARYAYLATWGVASLLGDLAGHEVNVQSARREFRQLLLSGVASRTGKGGTAIQAGELGTDSPPQVDI
jgi:hypothetical protein